MFSTVSNLGNINFVKAASRDLDGKRLAIIIVYWATR